MMSERTLRNMTQWKNTQIFGNEYFLFQIREVRMLLSN